MRIGFSILFMSIILIRVFSDAFIMLDFIANQDYIEQTFCVNKNVPNSHCHGHCHLKKQLEKEESTNKSNHAIPPNEEQPFDLFYIVVNSFIGYQYFVEKQKREYQIQNGILFYNVEMGRRIRSP